MAALDRANEVRLARVVLKREVRSGALSLGDALVDGRAGSMEVKQLVECQHRWGRRRTLRVLRGLRIGEKRRVGDLTERQRAALVEACGERS